MSHTEKLTAVVDTVRRPEYTGENRCTPCTVLNLAIAIAVAGLATLAWAPAGALVMVVSLLVIYLRGYLVPATPTITKRYFPEWVLRRFDKATEPAPGAVPETSDPEALEEFFVSAGVLEPCEGGEELCLTPGFRRDWRDRIEATRSDAGDTFREALDVSELLEVDPDRLDVDRRGSATVASVDDVRIAQWESEAAYVADVAAAGELKARYAGWEALGFESRTRMLGGLRLWLDWCPDCDGPVAFDQETVESCCRSRDVLAATCQRCGTRLFEAEYAPNV